MPRTDNDSWDLASGVGVTATAVAASRALASRAPTPLIDDPFAEPLVRAVGVDYFVTMAHGELAFDPNSAMPDQHLLAQGMAIRTKYFDEFFLSATASGVRQAVILAAGLDARSYRLPWPDGTTVFELDQPEVTAFKTRTFDELGATPTAALHSVGVDLRDDWPTALRDAGFDPAAPTAWIAEGLLAYLPPEAQDRLFDAITTLSAPGSRIATDWAPDMNALTDDKLNALTEEQRKAGLDLDGGIADLIYLGERSSVVDDLQAKGWDTTTVSVEDVFMANGLEFRRDDIAAGLFDASYTSAQLG
jgi:methyltransferase (TIGR00027 family)